MLTIKAPITLKNDPSMLRLTDNFHERLMGNYQMLTASLEPEDLLHRLRRKCIWRREG